MRSKFNNPTVDDHKQFILRTVLKCCAFLAIIVTAIYVGVSGQFKPANEFDYDWFARSGALIIVFALFIEAELLNLERYRFIKYSGYPEAWEAFQEYNWAIGLAKLTLFGVIIAGTVIWAYGDLLFKWYFY